MLNYLRKKRKGIFGAVILGLVSLTMIGFGVEFFARENPNPPAVTIGKTEVSQRQFFQQLERSRQSMRSQLGAQYEQYSKLIDLPQQTLDQLIDQTLLRQLQGKFGLVAGKAQIMEKVFSQPFFANGKTQQSYRAFLGAINLTGEQLEALTAEEVVNEQLLKLLSDVAAPSEAELKAINTKQKEEKAFEIVQFPSSAFLAKAAPTEEEITQHFENDIEQYRLPRKVSFSAVSFQPKDFTSSVDVSEEDLLEYYEKNKQQYSTVPKVSFRRIVLKKTKSTEETSVGKLLGKEKAEEKDSAFVESQKEKAKLVLSQLEEGASFDSMVEQYSEDASTKNQGGKIEWATYSSLEQAIRESLYRSEVGQLSSVLETDSSFSILLVDGKREKAPKPFSEVKEVVESEVKNYYAPEYARAEAENFLSELQAQTEGSIETLAKKHNRAIETTSSPLTETQSLSTLGGQVTAAALGLADGDSQIVEVGNYAVVISTKQIIESELPELTQVRDEIEGKLVQENSLRLAKSAAQSISALVNAGEVELAAAAKEQGLEVKTTEAANSSNAKDPALTPNIRQKAFALSKGETGVELDNGIPAIFKVVAVNTPEDTSFDSAKLGESEQQQASYRLLRALRAQLRSEVTITPNADVLGRANS